MPEEYQAWLKLASNFAWLQGAAVADAKAEIEGLQVRHQHGGREGGDGGVVLALATHSSCGRCRSRG